MSGRTILRRHTGLLALVPILMWSIGVASAKELTLDDSIAIALRNNPTVKIAAENISKADATIRQATSPGLPQISLLGTYTRVDQVPVASIPGSSTSFPIGTLDSRTADLTVDQVIDVFGLVKTARRTAKYGMSLYSYGLEQALNDTTLQTKNAYYDVLRAQSLQRVEEDTVAQLQAHLKDTQARQQAGDATKFEALRAQTEVANAGQGLITAQNGVQLAKAAFNNVLVRPVDTPVELAEPGPPTYYNLDMRTVMDSAAQNRPEILQADMLVHVDDGLAKVAELSGRPKVGLHWDYNENFDTTFFSPRASSWRGLVTASISLFDGGAARASTDLAKSDANNARSSLRQVHDGVVLDAKQAYLDVTSSHDRIAAAEKGLEAAKESMRLADVRYKGGVSTQVEVLDAQAALTLASTNYVSALYDYQESLARLERAVGGAEHFAALVANKPAATVK